MFGQAAILDPYDVGRDKRRRASIARETPVDDHIVAFGHDQAVLVAEGAGQVADEIEQPVAARPDVSAVLEICV